MLGLVVAAVEVIASAVARRRGRAPVAIAVALALLVGLAVVVPGDFAAQKVVARLAMPTGLLTLLGFGLAVYDLRTGRPARAAWSFGLWGLFLLSGSVVVGSALVAPLEDQTAADDPSAPFDAVFVLGGGTRLGPGREPQLGTAGDRLRKGAALWHAGRTRYLVASGFGPPPYGAGDLSATTAAIWNELGVPDEAIVRLGEPVNTAEEIAAYRKIADERGWARMGLVSSAWHLPRALALARKAGLEVVPLPCDHRSYPRDGPFHSFWLLPQREGFELVDIGLYERLGRALGR